MKDILVFLKVMCLISFLFFFSNNFLSVNSRIDFWETQKLIQMISDLKEIVVIQQSQIDVLSTSYEELKPTRIQTVTITAYHPPSMGINSDSDHKHTATMTKPKPGKTAAISRDLIPYGWMWREFYAPGIGRWKIESVMGKEFRGKPITKHIDLCFPTKKLADKFGIKRDVVVTMLD